MKLLYEQSVLEAPTFFAQLGDCQPFKSGTLQPHHLKDVDALLVRSTTAVTPELLSQADKLQFVGTATAGTNHVDKTYLAENDIRFVSAAGCNAEAVAEYVISVLVIMALKNGWQLTDKKVGVLGAGHVGTALSRKLDALGVAYRLCDPPLEQAGDARVFHPLDALMECDVISLHVPLVEEGPYSTRNLFGAERLANLNRSQLLINACRGEVVDNQALLELFKQGWDGNVVLDVWDKEPDIELGLLPYVKLATAHIAGHTLEGKVRGTAMLYQALCQHLGVEETLTLSGILPEPDLPTLDIRQAKTLEQALQAAVLPVYDARADDRQFRDRVTGPEAFNYIRRHYAIRREFAAAQLCTGNSPFSEAIYRLGFNQA
ncbi:4-phosphoerythronate dehydrogenase [Saliniradius amylolyticus]|uniref:Erythronate-4-phosphate dehydrogenase n=1 Tax=Saliniradius amylolyticus TaxID=2183582 RepID=A0A2S2E450_9ALTE|nr:4-phosphoerythronate dehydrogenase [Saliniradius amylolyticus]AWL12425.1 4-phosphoerythronate dehydrogenase [Saliniradius amylolyticus]